MIFYVTTKKKITAQMMVSFFFLAIKHFKIKLCTLHFRHNAIAHLIQHSVNIPFICTGKSKKSCDLIFTILQWSETKPEVSPR